MFFKKGCDVFIMQDDNVSFHNEPFLLKLVNVYKKQLEFDFVRRKLEEL